MKSQTALAVHPVNTRIFRRGEKLFDFVIEHVPQDVIHESMILAVTSKIVSLSEMRLTEKSSISKEQLVEQEADHNLGEVGYGCFLTIKHGLFIPSAGIDESNSEGDQYILYPKDPFQSARHLCESLKECWSLEKLGVLMTDSHTTPLRRGVTGISLAHWGFSGLKDMIGSPDLFGRKMKMTTVNVADALASAATLLMGEANESRPLAILRCEGIEFMESIDIDELKMPIRDDLYFPFFKTLLKEWP
jgi:F420-0:gamma-glutamyl ligase